MSKYRIFTPKGDKDLRVLYPELSEFPEFKSHLLSVNDMLFVWWYSCRCSPLWHEKDEDKRLKEAIEKSYATPRQRAAKLSEFSDRMPDNIKQALRRMESFNDEARIESYLQTVNVRENCKAMLSEEVAGMSDEAKDAWAKRAMGLWKLFDETTKAIERGAFGVTEYEEEQLEEADGTLREFRQMNM